MDELGFELFVYLFAPLIDGNSRVYGVKFSEYDACEACAPYDFFLIFKVTYQFDFYSVIAYIGRAPI